MSQKAIALAAYEAWMHSMRQKGLIQCRCHDQGNRPCLFCDGQLALLDHLFEAMLPDEV